MKRIICAATMCSCCVLSSTQAGDETTALPAPETASGADSGGGDWWRDLFSGVNRLDVQAETLRSSDIDIDQKTIQFEIQQPIWSFSLTAGHTDYGIDYKPAIVGSEAFLSEETWQWQGRIGAKLNERWSFDFSTRHYDGYSGYRSIWIAERFRQGFGFSPIYQKPDPGGYSYSASALYSYLSGHSVRLSIGYGRDTIAPGYSIGVGGIERSRDTLFRRSSTLRFEDVWTPWLKSENTISVADVTLRKKRWSAKSTWHVALGSDWTLRANVGYSEEAPLFEAKYGGLSVEWNFTGNWHISAGVDVYSDTGEIPNAGLITTAAPGVDTVQYGIGLRWVGESSAFRIYAAMYENDYGALGINNQFLKNLYRDRDWVMVQLSYTYQF
ncbi:MAG: hypothetical protein ACPG32_01515 [Akkermansiaceae bacterium]